LSKIVVVNDLEWVKEERSERNRKKNVKVKQRQETEKR
jgi:hypothetical protein